nr:Chain C, TYR-MET-MET-PRO-ARG-HIS-TRP-PRO-ILE [Xenopus laevis]
YMMPRHWPI